jgi:hypothetical protein
MSGSGAADADRDGLPGGERHRVAVGRCDRDPARTVQPAMATHQVGADTRHVGVGLAAVVPVRHVAVATPENGCGVKGTGYRLPGAVDSARVGHRDNRPEQRFAWYAGPVGAFAADEFAFHHRNAQAGGAGTSGDILADRSPCAEIDGGLAYPAEIAAIS